MKVKMVRVLPKVFN